MKNIFLFAQFALVSGFAFAQAPMPSSITPLNSAITLKYAPKFEARCAVKTYAKKLVDDKGEQKTEANTFEVFEDPNGLLKMSMQVNMGANYLRMIFGLNSDGAGFLSTEPEIQTDFKMTEADNKTMLGLKNALLKMMEWAYKFGVIGKPLHQGDTSFDLNLCELIKSGSTKSKSSNFVVTGTAFIKGRENVIISGDQAFVCAMDGKQLGILTKGWYAFDRDSGLQSDSSTAGTISLDGNEIATSTEDRDCVFTGALTKVRDMSHKNTPGKKSSAKRF